MPHRDNESASLRQERGEHRPDLPDASEAAEHSLTAFGRGAFAEPAGEGAGEEEPRTVDEDREAAERRTRPAVDDRT